jgi:hypothetical protein
MVRGNHLHVICEPVGDHVIQVLFHGIARLQTQNQQFRLKCYFLMFIIEHALEDCAPGLNSEAHSKAININLL